MTEPERAPKRLMPATMNAMSGQISLPSRFIATTVAVLCLTPLGSVRADKAESLKSTLSRSGSLNFDNVPLDRVLTELSRSWRIPIVADRHSLHDDRIDLSKIPVSHQSADVALENALETILMPHKLTWLARHDALVVTTDKAAAEDYLETRVYRVTRRISAERRMQSISQNVAPVSWFITGGTGDIAPIPPKLLLVLQSPPIHKSIARRFASSVVPVHANDPVMEGRSELETQLASPATVFFAETTLANAVKKLAQQTRVSIVIDHVSLANAGIRLEDVTVTLQAGRVRRLASALSLLVENASRELEWLVRGDKVVITTAVSAQSSLVSRKYDVAGIVSADRIAELVEAIQFTLEPASWDVVGGEGSIETTAGALTIAQSDPVHRRLSRVLACLRTGRKASK